MTSNLIQNSTACFAGTRLEALLTLEEHFDVTLVITVPNSRVHQHLMLSNQPFVLVTRESKTMVFDLLASQEYDLVLSAGFPYLFPAYILSKGPLFINSHPSLLPDYKGYNAIKNAFHAREEFMGVTVHHMDETFDTGTIIHQEKHSVLGLNLEEIYPVIFGQVEPKTIRQALAILSPRLTRSSTA